MMYGSQYHDKIVDTIRHAAELCDSLQCFFLLHSMGGGKPAFISSRLRKTRVSQNINGMASLKQSQAEDHDFPGAKNLPRY